MQLLDLTLESPAENLALDEALLEQAEAKAQHVEVLRLWEPTAPVVVLGRSSPLSKEVNLDFCHTNHIPLNRRCSGGQTIVTGPGCLMYAVLLDYRLRPELRMLDQAHGFVMQTTAAAIASLGIDVQQQGTSDLTLGNQKFSGNSLRCKRNWMIYHGTLLCDFDLSLISKCLDDPIRRPDYRGPRSHEEFLTTLPCDRSALKEALIAEWKTTESFDGWPEELTRNLVAEKYSSTEWAQRVG